VTFWSGVMAPAGTPVDIVAKLNSAISDGLRTPAVRESLAKIGSEAAPGSPQEFADFIAAETKKWGAVAKLSGISLD
jgi:tripartite-type tricarboxylate transporter receptor subunit TctC